MRNAGLVRAPRGEGLEGGADAAAGRLSNVQRPRCFFLTIGFSLVFWFVFEWVRQSRALDFRYRECCGKPRDLHESITGTNRYTVGWQKAATALRDLAANGDHKLSFAAKGKFPAYVAQRERERELFCYSQRSRGSFQFSLPRRVPNSLSRERSAENLGRLVWIYGEFYETAGGIEAMVSVSGSRELSLQCLSTAALRHLSLHDDLKRPIVETGALQSVARNATRANEDLQCQIAGLLANLSEELENQLSLVAAGCVPPLCTLARVANEEIQQDASRALCNVCSCEENHVNAYRQGDQPACFPN